MNRIYLSNGFEVLLDGNIGCIVSAVIREVCIPAMKEKVDWDELKRRVNEELNHIVFSLPMEDAIGVLRALLALNIGDEPGGEAQVPAE